MQLFCGSSAFSRAKKGIRSAEEALGLIALDRIDDALGDVGRRVHRHARALGKQARIGREVLRDDGVAAPATPPLKPAVAD